MKDQIYKHTFDENGYRREEIKPDKIKKAKAIILKNSVVKAKGCHILNYDMASELFDYFFYDKKRSKNVKHIK
jgi:hypothetical protein